MLAKCSDMLLAWLAQGRTPLLIDLNFSDRRTETVAASSLFAFTLSAIEPFG